MKQPQPDPHATRSRGAASSEAEAWQDVGPGWQPLFASEDEGGFRVQWHDFHVKEPLDWGTSFQPGGVELCLNLDGHGYVEGMGDRAEFTPNTAGFYCQSDQPLKAQRLANQQHRFLTVDFSFSFLGEHLAELRERFHPVVRAAMDSRLGRPAASATVPMNASLQHTIAVLRRPPVHGPLEPVWYRCKALELAVMLLTKQPSEKELFCTRQQRLARERTEQAGFLLRQNLAEPPTLEELGRKIGCSPFYLSRIFSAEMGRTITQYLRQLRMDRAAELLRSREYNVSEVALEVGYNSLSHFSTAFHETFGCCPGLYPLQTPAQKACRRAAQGPDNLSQSTASGI